VRSQAVGQAKTQNQFRLLAISLGGMVAMEWMRQDAQSLSGCVLINTSSRAHSPFYNRLRWQIWGQFSRAIAITSPREREKVILDMLMNNEQAKADAFPLWLKIAKERPVSYLNFANQLAAAARFKGLGEKPAVPVLLLNSLGDRLVEPSCSTDLHKAWGCSLERHPWGGHELTWDDPEWTLSKIRTWNDSNLAPI
jgi:pimeloyl-ACP methyl ester carboxylesterase